MAKILAFDGKQTDSSDNILRKVQGRPKNATVRSREFLALDEVEALMKAAGNCFTNYSLAMSQGVVCMLSFSNCDNQKTITRKPDKKPGSYVVNLDLMPSSACKTVCSRTELRSPLNTFTSHSTGRDSIHQPKYTNPTGLSGLPPPGPAIPVTDTVTSTC